MQQVPKAARPVERDGRNTKEKTDLEARGVEGHTGGGILDGGGGGGGVGGGA